MNEKSTSALQKAQQERKRGLFPKAIKRLEQAIAAFPDDLDLYIEAIDVCLDAGEVMQATNLLKTTQDKFTKERDRISQFVRDKLEAVHDPSLARCVVEHAVKRRDLEAALGHLNDVPEHVVRELLNRTRTKKQSLMSASHGGYTLRGEQMTNELMAALLSVRLGQLKEAMATFVDVLDEKPVEHKMIDPFLASLEQKFAKSGRVRFARACSLRSNGLEVDAIGRFVEAARLEPVCAALSADRLKAMREGAKHPAKIEHALAEVLLVKGDFEDAAGVLRLFLEEHPDNGREVIMLIKPFIDPAGGINPCTWLAVETALVIEQSNAAMDILRPLHQRGGHTEEIYDWLEAKAKDGFLPADVMTFHGTLAIELKKFERAAEILGAVCSISPQDVPAVLAIVDRHRTAHASLGELYTKHAPKESDLEQEASVEETDFQIFDNKEFRLEQSERPIAGPPKSDERPDALFAKPTAPFGATKATMPKKSLMDAAELSLDDLSSGSPKTPETAEARPVVSSDAAEARPVLPAARAIEITEAHVTGVAQKLYESGAAAFFHVDDGTASDEPVVTAAPASTPAPVESGPAGRTAEPAAAVQPTDFESEYARFAGGKLDNAAILALLARAVDDGRVTELEKLLGFEPANESEKIARQLYQAEHHSLCSRPMQALEILKTLDASAMSDAHKRHAWYRTAVCQRSVQDFAGAKETLARLVEKFPGVAEYERLAERNYEQYLNDQCRETTVLEKTSSLD